MLVFPRAADPDAGTMRIYNTSPNSGPVTATVYIQGNGTPLVSNCQLSANLLSNSSLILSASQFERDVVRSLFVRAQRREAIRTEATTLTL